MKRILLAIAVMLLLTSGGASAGEKYVFVVPIVKELAESGMTKMITELVTIVSGKTGIDMTADPFPYEPGRLATDIVLKSFKDGKAHMGYVNAIEYADLKDKYAGLFRPEFILAVNGSKYEEMCMYVAVESSAHSVADTRGMVWGGSDTLGTRLILHENGIDEPLASYYKEVKYVTSSPMSRLVESLMDGEFEVFAVASGILKMSGKVTGGTGKSGQTAGIPYREIYCTTYQSNWIFGYRNDFPEELSKKITKTVLNAHKDKDFARFHFMFIALKGHFIEMKEGDFDRTLEIKKLKDTLGWDKERKDFNAKAKSGKQ